jgi:RNA polymerase sigma-70 factor, ECF subfamily
MSPSPPATLEELLRPILGRAYGYALSLTGNAADADDLLQDAALAACRGFQTFRPESDFKPWFFAILSNCHYAKHRKRRKEGDSVELGEVPDLFLFERAHELGVSQTSADPAALLLSRLTREEVDHALQRLPEEFRTVAALYFLEDLSYEEIGGIVGVPVGTVRSRLHRGRKVLQRHLWQAAVDSGIVAELQGGNA